MYSRCVVTRFKNLSGYKRHTFVDTFYNFKLAHTAETWCGAFKRVYKLLLFSKIITRSSAAPGNHRSRKLVRTYSRSGRHAGNNIFWKNNFSARASPRAHATCGSSALMRENEITRCFIYEKDAGGSVARADCRRDAAILDIIRRSLLVVDITGRCCLSTLCLRHTWHFVFIKKSRSTEPTRGSNARFHYGAMQLARG